MLIPRPTKFAIKLIAGERYECKIVIKGDFILFLIINVMNIWKRLYVIRVCHEWDTILTNLFLLQNYYYIDEM